MKNLTKSIIENIHWSKSNILMHEIKALANVPEPKNPRSTLNFGWKNGKENSKSNWESLMKVPQHQSVVAPNGLVWLA
jgi:hypothetical protein